METKSKLVGIFKSRKTWALLLLVGAVLSTLLLVRGRHEERPVLQCMDLDGAEIRLKVPDARDRMAIRKACKTAGGVLKKETAEHG